MTSIIKNQSAFNRRLLESVSDVIFVLDLDNGKTYFLNAADQLWPLDGKGNDDIQALVHPEDRERWAAHIADCLNMGDHESKEIDIRLRTDEYNFRGCRVRNLVFKRKKDGSVRRITGIIRLADDGEVREDVNRLMARKNRELQFIRSELQTFTTLVAQDYLETLRQVYISLEMIISAEAHRFSNPSKAHLRRAQSMLQKLNLLTKDIVEYAAINAPEDKLAAVDLKEVVEGVARDLAGVLEAVRANLYCLELPVIRGYPLLLPVLFNHLVSNCVKFRHSTRPLKVTISSEDLSASSVMHAGADTGKSYHKIVVKDNGIGFDPVDREKIFELFYQGHDRVKYKGSGMGLAIVRKIMDIHGGYVAADGIPGEGSNFCCYFPI